MAFLNRLGRSASTYMGITAPRPEQEQFFGVVILVLSAMIAAGTIALFFFVTHLLLR